MVLTKQATLTLLGWSASQSKKVQKEFSGFLTHELRYMESKTKTLSLVGVSELILKYEELKKSRGESEDLRKYIT